MGLAAPIAALPLASCSAAPSTARSTTPSATRPAGAADAPAGPAPAAGPLQKVTVAFVAPGEALATPWMAKEGGFFAKYGFDAEVPLITGSPRLTQSLIAGDVEYAVVGVTAVVHAAWQGADAVLLAATTNYSSQRLWAHPRAGIRTLADLRGKTVGITQYGSEGDSFLRVVLGRVGLRPEEVSIIQVGGTPQVAAALATGNIDAGIMGVGSSLPAQQIGAIEIADGQGMNVLAPAGTLATTRRYVERERESVRRFLRAYVEATHFFKTNRDGAIRIMQQYMGASSPDEVAPIYDAIQPVYERVPYVTEEAIQAVIDREIGPDAGQFKASDVIDASFLREIEESGLVAQLYR